MAQKPQLIAGIGASAGGLEALRSLLRPLAADTGIAFLVMTHMPRGQDSAMSEILSRYTTMPVRVAADGELVEADHLYVCPPDHLLTVSAGRMRLERDAVAHHKPIDVFLSSLASDKGEGAIGILLSGGGSDGAIGLKHIKEHGGLTIAQGSDRSAPRQSGMPDSAIAAGVVDLVLSVEDMPARLAEYARSFQAAPVDEDKARPAQAVPGSLEPIYKLLLHQVGHDFSGYKPNTFARRVQRRMQVVQIEELDAYVDHLEKNRDEVRALFRDLLIGVTNFFRDAEAFDLLQQIVIPQLSKDRGADASVRIWVPGCATGEEVYSLAMLMREHLDKLPETPKVLLFATDIDDHALAIARAARYPASSLGGVSPARLARFFTGDANSKVVSKEIRELCVFSSHSVVRDPPFSRIDLISCRNLLIYLGPEFQSRVIPVFHFALRPGGYLFLGTSESISQYANLFTPLEKKQRIFQRRDNVVAPVRFPLHLGDRGKGIPLHERDSQRPVRHSMERTVQARIAERFAPAHVVVNRDGDVLFYSSRTGKYLEAPVGAPDRRLMSMTRPGLRPQLRAALREAVETGRPTTRGTADIEVDDRIYSVAITVEPLGANEIDSSGDSLYLVVFTDIGLPTVKLPGAETIVLKSGDGHIEAMEKDLREARHRLQVSTQEHENTVDELKSANEELQSLNEEYQSTNEEMETSKEELQSLNEELNTVNAELNSKIELLDTANADLRNVLNSTGIATIFLDRNLVIRSFTTAATALFNLLPRDHGRPLTDIVAKLSDVAHLTAEVKKVLETGQAVRRRVHLSDSSEHYLMHILPYVTEAGSVNGALITFVEVTELVVSEAQLRTLVEELNHRVRNMLAVIGSIASQTAATSPAPQDFAKIFLGRLNSMAKAYSLIAEQRWGSVTLGNILKSELEPYHQDGTDRIKVEGPEVGFPPQQALALGLVFHELATNAAKYGALSTTTGNISAKWQLEDGALEVDWIETGGPRPKKMGKPGFGTKLIDAQLRAALSAEVRRNFSPAGLRVRFVIPRSSRD